MSTLPPEHEKPQGELQTELVTDRVADRDGEGLSVQISEFEGPLDLLLHLVRTNDMDILELSIVEIARQYNAYLDQMTELDLEVASEYLVMATTLAHIKSRLMLPPDPTDPEEEDPRAELSRQLLEYEKFKRAAEELAVLESGRDLIFTRDKLPPADISGAVTIKANLSDLVRAFERVLQRLEQEEQEYVLRREDVPLESMMEELVNALAIRRSVSFRELLRRHRTRLERVCLFLALLELIRLGAVSAFQTSFRDDIRIEPALDFTTFDLEAVLAEERRLDVDRGDAAESEVESTQSASESEDPSNDDVAPDDEDPQR